MKKIYTLLIGLIFVFSSCSKNDSQTDESTVILPKKIVQTGSFSNTTTIIYVGNKIATATNSDGTKAAYSYTGNFITKVENFDSKNTLIYTTDYIYDNGKLSFSINKETNSTDQSKTAYTHNVDGSVTYVRTILNTLTNISTQSRIGTYTYLKGNIINAEETLGTTNYTITFEFDNKNNPIKNIEGMNLLIDNFYARSLNNVTKLSSINNSNAIPQVYTTTYVYDSKGFPIECNNSNGVTKQYFY